MLGFKVIGGASGKRPKRTRWNEKDLSLARLRVDAFVSSSSERPLEPRHDLVLLRQLGVEHVCYSHLTPVEALGKMVGTRRHRQESLRKRVPDSLRAWRRMSSRILLAMPEHVLSRVRPMHPRLCSCVLMYSQTAYRRTTTTRPSAAKRHAPTTEPLRGVADPVLQIDALYECCNAFYKKNGDDASTVSCPKANLLRYSSCQRGAHCSRLTLPARLKMKQRAQGIR